MVRVANTSLLAFTAARCYEEEFQFFVAFSP
jgi:hypothetical protein